MKQLFFAILFLGSSLAYGLTPEELNKITIQSGQQVKAAFEHSEMMQKKKEAIVREMLLKREESRKRKEKFAVHEGLEIYKQDGISELSQNYDKEDLAEKFWDTGGRGFHASNIQKANGDLRQISDLANYIDYCNRFPLNIEDIYKPIENAPKNCKPEIIHPMDVKPWVDPWGRTYQIRYNQDRMKIQMRSRGRNPNDLSDDVIREKEIPDYKKFYKEEIEKCKKLSTKDMTCAFNRGWH